MHSEHTVADHLTMWPWQYTHPTRHAGSCRDAIPETLRQVPAWQLTCQSRAYRGSWRRLTLLQQFSLFRQGPVGGEHSSFGLHLPARQFPEQHWLLEAHVKS